ncbi:MAG: DnaA N-terminal domain-containing protein, partial [Bacillota bacterium]
MVDRADALWQKVLEVMQGEISKPSYETWLRGTEGVALNGNTLVVRTLHDIGRKFLDDNYRQP